MARTVEFAEVVDRMVEVYSARSSEQWAELYEQEVQYGPGVRPSLICMPEAETAFTTYVQETEAP